MFIAPSWTDADTMELLTDASLQYTQPPHRSSNNSSSKLRLNYHHPPSRGSKGGTTIVHHPEAAKVGLPSSTIQTVEHDIHTVHLLLTDHTLRYCNNSVRTVVIVVALFFDPFCTGLEPNINIHPLHPLGWHPLGFYTDQIIPQ